MKRSYQKFLDVKLFNSEIWLKNTVLLWVDLKSFVIETLCRPHFFFKVWEGEVLYNYEMKGKF